MAAVVSSFSCLFLVLLFPPPALSSIRERKQELLIISGTSCVHLECQLSACQEVVS